MSDQPIPSIVKNPVAVCGSNPENSCSLSCCCLLQFYKILTQPKQPFLIRAELFTLTGDGDNKDHDTEIFVSVKSVDGKMLLASIANADGSGKDMTEYNDDSYHIIPLVIDAPGAIKTDCDQFKVHMWIKTKGSDTWTIDLTRVTLFFSDGTNLIAELAGSSLTGDTAFIDFNSQ